MWSWIFWLSVAFIFYTYAGYPLILALWRRIKQPQPPAADPDYTPMVSVILTVRNEEANVGRKLDWLLEQDYPADRMEIWVASDQSTDRTNEIVREYEARDPRVRLVEFTENIGKSVAINRVVPRMAGEIIVSSDVRQRIEPDTVSKLVRNFADPKVGVCGAELVLVNGEGSDSEEGTGAYWRYERGLRRLESSLGLLAGVAGCFLAVRRSVFRDIPPNSYCEDVTLCLYARQQGYVARWEPEARVYETMRDPGIEFRRKVRTLVGNYQLLSQFWPLYLPWRGSLAFTLLSHKVCRLVIPAALLALLVASIMLAPTHLFYTAALAGQVGVYAAGCLALARAELRRNRLANACGAFCLLNYAAALAFFHVLRHGPRIAWR